MSDLNFDKALCALNKAQDGKTLINILLKIREEVNWPINKDRIALLRKRGCLKHFVKILSMQKKAVDVSLSILGNCVMDEGCTREVIGVYNILTPLSQLIKKYPDEDSINGRIFRIMGNMCHHRDQWGNIIIDRKPFMVSHMVDIIRKAAGDEPDKRNFSEATISMAIRTLRLLLNSSTILSLVRQFKVLKAIGALFIKTTLDWKEHGKGSPIILNIIRLLQDYSRYKCYHSILQMRNTEKGNSLLYLNDVLLLAPKNVVKIVMNFIKISQLKSELPIPEICDKFIDEIFKTLNAREVHQDCMEYIQCLCYLLDNPANRRPERCGKCLPILIKILEEYEELTNHELELCILIIATLNKCTYDESLIQQQIKCNIVDALLKKLEWVGGGSGLEMLGKNHKRGKPHGHLFFQQLDLIFTASSDSLHGKRKSEPPYGKRKCMRQEAFDADLGLFYPELLIPQSPPTPGPSEEIIVRLRGMSPSSSDDEATLNKSRHDRSPSPYSSNDSCSSPISPHLFTNGATDSDSDEYSPVCSEADANEFPPSDEDEPQFKGTPADDLEDEEELEELQVQDTTKNLKSRLITGIINLIKTLSKVRPPVPQLGSSRLLLALLKCTELVSHYEVTCVTPIEAIARILESPEYLIPLMTNNFIENIFDLRRVKHKDCKTCVDYLFIGRFIQKRLISLAESEVGKGDIANRLLRGTNDLKEKLVLVIPYVVRNKSILSKLMLNCGGLELLMQLLQEESVLKERTCNVLCAMASTNLQIANPTHVVIKSGIPNIIRLQKYKLNEDCTNIVTFKLDDGTSLDADREFLCSKSDFFGSLLQGHFKESNQDEVNLSNVQPKSLECLIQLLNCPEIGDNLKVKMDLETMLDVVVLSDRYLLPDLCNSLIDSIERWKISWKTVPIIYRWSLESGTNLLRVECIAYALVANVNDCERFQMFQNLLNLGYASELLDDIHKLLLRYLKSSAR